MSAVAAAGPRPTGPVQITICTSCRPQGLPLAASQGLSLFAAVTAVGGQDDRLQIRPTQCLGVCTRVCSVAISAVGGYTYVFGDLDPKASASALVALARACAEAPYGHIPWKDRPQELRNGLIARIAPPNWSPDDGSAPP